VAVTAAALGTACHLGDLISPGASVPGTEVARSLTLAPTDTTLTSPGDSVCLRWTARDGAGAIIAGVIPTFTFVTNPGGRLGLSTSPGCVKALAMGGTGPGRVRATVDSASAEAVVRASP